MKYTYGPVRSRRYGWSLGIDIMPKLKTCTYNCVYCELGLTSLKGFVSIRHQSEIPPGLKADLGVELKEKLIECSSYVNVFTFGYNGEPTLNRDLRLLFDLVRKIRFEAGIERVPITTLTNSSMLGDPDVRRTLSNFDIVVVKLDAGTQEVFSSTNNPHHTVPSIKQIIENIKLLKTEMKKGSELFVQTLLYKVRSPTSLKSNATRENVVAIAKAVNEIQPDQVQIYTVARPPAEPKVRALSKMELIEFSDLMAEHVKDPTEVFHFR